MRQWPYAGCALARRFPSLNEDSSVPQSPRRLRRSHRSGTRSSPIVSTARDTQAHRCTLDLRLRAPTSGPMGSVLPHTRPRNTRPKATARRFRGIAREAPTGLRPMSLPRLGCAACMSRPGGPCPTQRLGCRRGGERNHPKARPHVSGHRQTWRRARRLDTPESRTPRCHLQMRHKTQTAL